MNKKHRSRWLCRFARANEAVSALEYAILVGVVAVGVGAAVNTFSGNITDAFQNIGGQIAAPNAELLDIIEE